MPNGVHYSMADIPSLDKLYTFEEIGTKTRTHMIAQWRVKMQNERNKALELAAKYEAALALPDDKIRTALTVGKFVRKFVRLIK